MGERENFHKLFSALGAHLRAEHIPYGMSASPGRPHKPTVVAKLLEIDLLTEHEVVVDEPENDFRHAEQVASPRPLCVQSEQHHHQERESHELSSILELVNKSISSTNQHLSTTNYAANN